MYTLTQDPIFTDQIELKKQNGTSEILDIQIDLSAETLKAYRELQIQLIDLQKKVKENPHDSKTIEEIGKAVVAVLSLLLGENNCKKIIDFYSDDFTKMMTDLFPYIQNVVVPQFQKIVKQRKRALKKKIWR